jgi:hypothetical protein
MHERGQDTYIYCETANCEGVHGHNRSSYSSSELLVKMDFVQMKL